MLQILPAEQVAGLVALAVVQVALVLKHHFIIWDRRVLVEE